MSDIRITLHAGEGLNDQADFDAWCIYVSARIDAATGLDVDVFQARFGESGEDVRAGSDHADALRDALRELWDSFCADPSAWPQTEDLAADRADGLLAHFEGPK